ncbi:MAG: hypothetical protein WD069_13465 [Planctomycetales bacterium]
MKLHFGTHGIVAGALIAGLVGWGLAPGSAQEPLLPPPDGAFPQNQEQEEEFEALTSGPVHEAFAEHYSIDPTPGLVVQKEPPEPIDEVPPDAMPEGENVVWIPGYWGWDPVQQDFVWVSGLWRNVPPNQRWVPGYWMSVEGGFQWISGFWTNAGAEDLGYLPYPPESLEQGPNIAPPSGDYFWVPGLWIWQGGDYAWRPGYWAPAHEQWVWMPARYVWTPYGCIHSDGYWDYALFQDRGLLFAPVYFPRPIYRTPGFRYVPQVVIRTDSLLISLFVSPRYNHYYFGNYYAGNFGDFPLVPWHSYASRRSYYDPLLTYHQWSYARRNIDFVGRLQSWNRFFVDHEDRRPSRTFRQQRQLVSRLGPDADGSQRRAIELAQPLAQLAAADDVRGRRLQRVSQPERDQFVATARQIRELQNRRGEVERTARAATAEPERRGAAAAAEKRLKLPEVVRRVTARPVAPEADGRRVERRPPETPRQVAPQPATRGERPETVRPDRERPRAARPEEREAPPQFPRFQARPAERPERPREARPTTPRVERRPEQPAPREAAPRPEARPQRPEARPARPEAKPQRPKAQPAARPEARAPRPEARPERREARPEPVRREALRPVTRPRVEGPRPSPAAPAARPESRPTPRPEVRREERPTPRPEARREARPTPRPETRREEARPTPRPETPRPEARREARPTEPRSRPPREARPAEKPERRSSSPAEATRSEKKPEPRARDDNDDNEEERERERNRGREKSKP